MVQNKHFKALVRERMQKTGERYTAARRHVLASRPGHPVEPGVLHGYPNVPVGGEASTGQYDAALWQRVLAQAGVTDPATGAPFTTAMLAGLGGGIGFMFATFVYQDVTTATVVLRGHPEPYTERLLGRSGAALERAVTTSSKLAVTTLEAALDAGRASVVRVTHGALPWISSESPEYQESIDVAVVGRDGDSLLIDGGGWSLGEDDGECLHRATPAELAEARGRRRADKHWAVSVASDPGEPDIEQLAAHARASIAETTGRLLGTLPLQGIPSSWLPKFGVSGMRTWAGLLRDQRTKQGWPSLFSDQERLRVGLRMVQGTAGGARWGGPGGLRGLYADFLSEASALPELGVLDEAATAYRELAPLWDEFVDAIDPDVAISDRIEQFAAMADRLDALATLEEQAARALSGAVERRGGNAA